MQKISHKEAGELSLFLELKRSSAVAVTSKTANHNESIIVLDNSSHKL